MATMPFNPVNWYWIVAGSATQVYSSAAGSYVPVANSTFVAWKAAGGVPSKIASEAELGAVLAANGLTSAASGILDALKDSQAAAIVAATMFRVLFNHENRLRAIERALSLNGSPADLTAGQAKAAVKALM